MEGSKHVGSSSSSSFTSELFGSRENPSSSSGILGSIFPPSSKAYGKESQRGAVTGKKPDSSMEDWNYKFRSTTGDSYRTSNSDNHDMSSIYQEQRVQQPCHLSSSIYYGGQDVYSHPQSNLTPGSNSTHKKDYGEDDSGSASRGNWWKGSLYY